MVMTSTRVRLAIYGSVVGLAFSSSAVAGEYDQFVDKWQIHLGAFWATVDSSISIYGEVLPPVPPVDVEGVLGVARSKAVPWGGIAWHFAAHHSVEAEFFSLTRKAEKTDLYDPPLQIGDTILESGTAATSYGTDVYRLTYGFSAYRAERSELQLKAGLHLADLSAGFSLAGAICDPTTDPATPPGCPQIGGKTESEEVSAPLPHIGISYIYAFAPNWSLQAAGMGFALEVNDIDGSILEADADVIWQPLRNFGIGAGYRYLRVDVDSGTSDLNGAFDFEYHGPTLYLWATF